MGCGGAGNLFSSFCLASRGAMQIFPNKVLYLGWWRDMGNFHKEALDTLPGKEAVFAFGKNQAVSSISLSNLFSSLGSGRFSVGL